MRGRGKDVLSGVNDVSKDSEVGRRASQAGQEDQNMGWGHIIYFMRGSVA